MLLYPLSLFVYASSALLGDSFVEATQFDPSICEVAGSLHDPKEPTIARLLQEKPHYSFSEWPKVCVVCLSFDYFIMISKSISFTQCYFLKFNILLNVYFFRTELSSTALTVFVKPS